MTITRLILIQFIHYTVLAHSLTIILLYLFYPFSSTFTTIKLEYRENLINKVITPSLFHLQNRKAYGWRPMQAQCGVAKLGGCLAGGNCAFSVAVSNKHVPLLAAQVGGEEIRLARAFSIARLHMPSCFATRIITNCKWLIWSRIPKCILDQISLTYSSGNVIRNNFSSSHKQDFTHSQCEEPMKSSSITISYQAFLFTMDSKTEECIIKTRITRSGFLWLSVKSKYT